ncbi:MAG: patatin-like phospholipase family protein [Flavobacterium sp.]|nr:patatin-like phospholipase family protein [Flavobacterium sp.]
MYSQEIPRKKIGLVLSGGGAKGFAHIGVLKVLERSGVKIDYIGGTSMGAVIGGLYASGYNASQIDSIFKKTDFNALVNDEIPRTSKNFYEKRNDELYALSLPFNNFKVGIPIALSKGLYNYNSLNQLFQHVRGITDFSKLPIPFVCAATDIETGKEVVLRNGYLPKAILASSAFPTLFSPIEIDGKLLIDGGVANNYPVERVREMGAEIIIGVDVQDDLKKRDELKEATRILVQITNLQMIENMKGKKALSDIYIKPEVSQYGVIEFNKESEIIKLGEEAANNFLSEINKLSSNIKPENVLHQPKPKDVLEFKSIEITDLENYTRAYIIGKLGFNANEKITYDDLSIGIDKINATQNFSTINYRIEKIENNSDKLILELKENTTKNFLKFGLHYDGLYKSAILANLTRKKSIFKNDVASLDIIFGDNFRYNFDYYLDNGFYTSFGIKSKFNSFNRNVVTDFDNGRLFTKLGISSMNINYNDLTNQFYIQTVYKQRFLVSAGAEYRHINIRSETLQNNSQVFENTDYYSLFGNLKFDSLDNKYFPTKGFYFCGDFQSYINSADFANKLNPFSIAKGDAIFATTFYNKVTIKLQSEIGFTVGNRDIPFLNFVFGGYGFNNSNNFKPFYGYDFVSIGANSFVKGTATLDYEFYKKNHVNISGNYANIANDLFRKTNEIKVPKYSGYAIGYGLETIIGPLELKYSWSPETQKGYAWFNVGFWF